MALTAIGDLVIDGGGNLSLTHAEGGGSTGLAGKGFQAFDEDHGLKVALAVGDGGAVTWIDLVKPSLDFDFSIEPSFAGRTARAVVLTGVDRALAVGDGGTIVRLHRGKGVNSEGLASGTTADLRGIALSPTNARVAYSVGSHGTVLRSTDAGANWTRMTADWRAAFPALAVEVSKPRVGGVIPSLPTDGIAARRVWMVPAPWYFASLLVVGGLVAIGLAPVVKKEPVAGGIRDSLDTDRPLEPGDRDVVGIGRLALAISRLLRNENTSPPLTLAVTGRWGQGKSSLMNLVRGDLRQFGIRPVWFNAWHHQDEETLLAGLLSSIRTQAVAPLWHVDGVGFRLRLLKQRFRRYLPHALLSLALFAGAVGYLAQTDESLSHSVAAIAGRVKAAMVYVGVVAGEDGSVQAGGAGKTLDLVIGDDESGSGTRVQGSLRDAPTGSPVAPLRATGQFAVVLASLPVLYGLYRSLRAFGADPAKLLAAVSEGAKVADLRQQASFRERFAREFAEVTRALRPRPMLIVIDDLDRCQPKRVVTVLEAVNFLASSGQCFIMLGMDPVIVEHCVALWYKSVSSTLPTPQEHEKGTQGPLSVEEQGRRSREFARRYIQKLIQLRIAVPEVSLDAVAALAADDRSSVPRTADPGPSKRRHWLREVAWAAGSTLMSGAPALAVVAGLVFCGWLGARLYVPPENPETDAQRTVASGAAPFAPGASNGAAPPNSATPGTSAEPPPSGAVGAGAALPQSPAAIIPATSTALLVWLVFAAGFAGTLMLAVREGLLQKAMVEGDSLEFTAATKKWLCVLHREGSTTPRAVRQAINRVRFLAMLQRPPTPTDPGLWARCLLRLGLAAPVSGRVPAPPRPSNTPVIESLVAWTLLQAGLDLPPGSIGHQQACNAAHARSPAAGALVAQEWSGLLDPNQSEYQQLALIVPMR
ncbi:MAG: P-loop NTPase fold protein [Phycisphaerales bacterium]